MPDQATLLRRLVHRPEARPATAAVRAPRLVVVSGGKGGVGTTTLAVALAAERGRGGGRVGLVDADPHHADVALLTNLRERFTLDDVLAGSRTAAESLQPGLPGVEVLPGRPRGKPGVSVSNGAGDRLLAQLALLSHRLDTLVIDAGNAPHPLGRRLWAAADLVLAVTTPEDPAVIDAFAAIKSMVASRPGGSPIHVAVNRAADAGQGTEVFSRLELACRRFLGTTLRHAGTVRQGPGGAAPAAEDVARLARAVEPETDDGVGE